jgi:signal transduction histidine kinase
MLTKRILIADDEEQTSFCIALALKMKNYKTVIANNGEQALQIIKESQGTSEQIDLLACDIEMPKVTGEELINRLNELKIRIPTLVITGYGNKDLVVRLMRKGCRDFIDKPFDPDEIEKRIHLILAEDAGNMLEHKRMETMARIGLRTSQLVHDMNNILCGTRGYVDLAFTTIEENHPTHDYLTQIKKATSRAADICKTLLAASRGSELRVFAPTEINSLVERSAVMLGDVIPANITIETRTNTTPLWCAVDAERIQQALFNLGINAAQAMPEGGRLQLECSAVESNDTRAIRLAVSDTGVGIPENIIGRIFDHGFTTRIEGTGIGLHTVQEIVQEHGGCIMVRSELKKGTTFTIDLPELVSASASSERISQE